MYELVLYAAVGAAIVRSAWLLIGLVRVIPVHLRARTRRWGLAEVLAFVELPVFLTLTCLLVLRLVPAPPQGDASFLTAVLGAVLALAGLSVSLWAIATTVRRRVILDAGHFVKEVHPPSRRAPTGLFAIPCISASFSSGSGSRWRFRMRFSCSCPRRTSCPSCGSTFGPKSA